MRTAITQVYLLSANHSSGDCSGITPDSLLSTKALQAGQKYGIGLHSQKKRAEPLFPKELNAPHMSLYDTFQPDSPWRHVAAAMYDRPRDGKIFGSVSIDITAVERYIEQKRESGIKMTLTHFFFLALGRAIRDKVPAFNTYIIRGRVAKRPSIDGSLSVLMGDHSNMTLVRINNVPAYKPDDIVTHLQEKIAQSKNKDSAKDRKDKTLLASIPWPFRRWLVRLISFLNLDIGIQLPALGLDNNRFGCFLLSNIGSIGLDVGYPSLFPNANLSIVVTMGITDVRPVYVDGEWIPRKFITLAAAMDHRVVDGIHGGQLFHYLKKICNNPGLLDSKE